MRAAIAYPFGRRFVTRSSFLLVMQAFLLPHFTPILFEKNIGMMPLFLNLGKNIAVFAKKTYIKLTREYIRL